MDKRVKMVFAGLCLCVMLVSCTDDVDTTPVPDMQEILNDDGIQDIRYSNGSSRDTLKND